MTLADDELRVAIFTGRGDRAFCAGRDLKWAAQHPESSEWTQHSAKGGFGGMAERFDLTKPIIAAVNGYALGGGLEMVLACDVIVASAHARFGLPDARVGYVAVSGGVQGLPRHMPLKIAAGMILTGKDISAQEAHQWGLVNQVVAHESLLASAKQWANDILECAPLAIRASKEMMYRSLDLPLEESIRRQYAWQQRALAAEDHREGVQAFAERRKPRWKGR
jgi:enoyl-CoA hydratase/carnithine racemase